MPGGANNFLAHQKVNHMARFTFSCIDAHTCGNPVRVVSGGGAGRN
jgi:hypothetical protein